MSTGLQLDNPFWQFSLRLYRSEEVQRTCLALQDSLAIDVNVLLFCIWKAIHHRVTLSDRDIEAVNAAAKQWQEQAVRPLRAARRNIKGLPQATYEPVQQFRARLAEVEIRAEQIEQAILFGCETIGSEQPHRSVADLMRANLDTYLRVSAQHGSPESVSLGPLIEAGVGLASHSD
jgi:uncharacterized protein (TIGR02444 family)